MPAQLQYLPDKGAPEKAITLDISDEVIVAITKNIEANPGRYSGVGDLLFQQVRTSILRPIVNNFPPDSIKDAEDAVRAAKEALIPVEPAKPDPAVKV